jgi:hypothetical protein
MYFIAGEDYARMATKAFKQFDGKNAEYIIQGTQAFTADEAAKIFVENYKKEKIKVMKLPFWMLQLFGKLSPKFNYGANIVEALNNYSEKLTAQKFGINWENLN